MFTQQKNRLSMDPVVKLFLRQKTTSQGYGKIEGVAFFIKAACQTPLHHQVFDTSLVSR